MGEAKRRKEQLGEDYGKTKDYILPGVPITKQQSTDFVTWTTRGAWAGITLMIVGWIVIRFVGPSAGWWEVQ
jgi:hypothetical protein